MKLPSSRESREPDFDRVAPIYRWAEYLVLGPLLQRTRTHFLPQLAGCRSAFVLGDGDGRFLSRLLAQNPSLHALGVDTSAAMLRLLQRRCRDAGDRVQVLQTSALAAIPPHGTDLIVTHFFLDCLTQFEVDGITANIAAHTQAGVFWLLSDFQVPQSGAIRPLARLYVSGLYLAFRLLTGLRVRHLPNPQASLANAGFTCIARHERVWGVIYTELWAKSSAGGNISTYTCPNGGEDTSQASALQRPSR